MGNARESIEEIGKRVQGLLIAPIEWFASAIKLDLPARKPEAVCEQHKAKSMIHVRIKLNASQLGDLMSHIWFPPVERYPSIPSFDPQVLWSRIMRALHVTEPYRNIFQYVEDVVKWKRPPLACIKAYSIFAFHIIVSSHILPLIHFYLFLFLAVRLHKARYSNALNVGRNAKETLVRRDSFHFDELVVLLQRNGISISSGVIGFMETARLLPGWWLCDGSPATARVDCSFRMAA